MPLAYFAYAILYRRHSVSLYVSIHVYAERESESRKKERSTTNRINETMQFS